MKDLHTVEIDGVKYKIECFPAKKSVKVLARLLKVVGGPMAAIATMVKPGDDKSLLDVKFDDAIGGMVSQLVSGIDEDEVLNLLVELTSCAYPLTGAAAGSASEDFDVRFQGKLNSLMKLATEVVKHNYSDFFGEGSALGAILKRRVTTQG